MANRTNITLSAAIGGVVGALLGGYSPRITPLFGAALGASVGGATIYFMEKKQEEETAALTEGPGCPAGTQWSMIQQECVSTIPTGGVLTPEIDLTVNGGLVTDTPDTLLGVGPDGTITPIDPAFANVSVQPIDPALMTLNLI